MAVSHWGKSQYSDTSSVLLYTIFVPWRYCPKLGLDAASWYTFFGSSVPERVWVMSFCALFSISNLQAPHLALFVEILYACGLILILHSQSHCCPHPVHSNLCGYQIQDEVLCWYQPFTHSLQSTTRDALLTFPPNLRAFLSSDVLRCAKEGLTCSSSGSGYAFEKNALGSEA